MWFKLLYLFIALAVSSSSVGQSLSKKDLGRLQGIFFDFLGKYDKDTRLDRKSEFIIGLFEIDSSGQVCEIDMLADDRNRDTMYSILKRMSPDVFKGWSAEKCKAKIIMVPFLSLAPERRPAYTEKIKNAYSVQPFIVAPLTIVNENSGLVALSVFQHVVPKSRE